MTPTNTPRFFTILALNAVLHPPDDMCEVSSTLMELLGGLPEPTIMSAADLTALAIRRIHTLGEIPMPVQNLI